MNSWTCANFVHEDVYGVSVRHKLKENVSHALCCVKCRYSLNFHEYFPAYSGEEVEELDAN